MHRIIQLFIDRGGAAAAEYALILAIVGSGIAAAAIFLGGAISTSLKTTGNEITSCTAAGVAGTC